MRADVVSHVARGFRRLARACVIQHDVESDARHHVHGPARLGAHFDEDAAQLAVARSPGRWAI